MFKQHAFHSGRSTVTYLLIADKYIAERINNSVLFDVISFDPSEAFDRMPHNRIVRVFYQVG